MMVYPIGIMFGSIRFKVMIEHLGKKIGFMNLMAAQFGGMLASDVTPGRTGYFIFPMLIKEDVPVPTGLSAILTVQVIDFLLKVISSIGGIIVIAYTAKLSEVLLVAILIGIFAVTIFAVIMMLMLWSDKSTTIFRFCSKLPFVGKFILKFEDQVEVFQKESHQLKAIMPKIMLLSLPAWLMKGMEWYLLGLAVGFGFPFWFYLFLQPFITIVQFVPLTPAGLGLQEGGSLLVLVILGATSESALLFSFLGRIILILDDLLGLPTLLRKGVSLSDEISDKIILKTGSGKKV
jgi:uncharacterized protein (TIRG00374 family)